MRRHCPPRNCSTRASEPLSNKRIGCQEEWPTKHAAASAAEIRCEPGILFGAHQPAKQQSRVSRSWNRGLAWTSGPQYVGLDKKFCAMAFIWMPCGNQCDRRRRQLWRSSTGGFGSGW
ncbi:MAG: hypothetical protein MZV63_27110 [Marinilabiliales bacterium]|nr:hypothetical protein [Marinilabiliales bacterium]